jgi:hypothetical protein
LQAGVPGAYRLFANLIAGGKVVKSGESHGSLPVGGGLLWLFICPPAQ